MPRARIFDFSLFLIALAIAIIYGHLLVDSAVFIKALVMYCFFSILYNHLRIINRNGKTHFDYGISYGLSFSIFAGPLGLFIFEAIYRFMVYIYKKITKTADETEFLDVFYNIGSFVVTNSLSYFLFKLIYPHIQNMHFAFWILMLVISFIFTTLSGTLLATVFLINKDLTTIKEAKDFIFKRTSLLDYGKTGLTNGLLFVFLQEQKWEFLIAFFILNYIVSRSFFDRAQSIQNKHERDHFEQMAYTDFLTGVHNRTFMDKKMAELNQTGECIGIVVADIDNFKMINDSFNHAVGDKVIQHFARTLKSYLDEDDFLFRSGGEEFTLIFRRRSFEQCVNLVESILSGIRHNSVDVEFNRDWTALSYTASFGLYYYQVDQQIPMEKGYIIADQLLLESKQLGKNKVSAENGLVEKNLVF